MVPPQVRVLCSTPDGPLESSHEIALLQERTQVAYYEQNEEASAFAAFIMHTIWS